MRGLLLGLLVSLSLVALLVACSSGRQEGGEGGFSVVFWASQPADCDAAQLTLIGPGEGAVRHVGTAASFVALRWSPDAATIAALVSGACDPQDRLVIIDADSGEEKIVPLPLVDAPRGYSALLWSPDGSLVAVYGDDLVVARRTGEILLEGGPRTDPFGINPGQWSDDGGRLAVLDVDRTLHVFASDGSALRAIPTVGADLQTPALLGWDGSAVVIWGLDDSSGTMKGQPLVGAEGPNPAWGPIEDPSDPALATRYGALFDSRQQDLRNRIREEDADAIFLREGAGMSSSGETVWDTLASDRGAGSAILVVAGEDGKLSRINLPGFEVQPTELAPVEDVILR